MREIIAGHLAEKVPALISGKIDIDESYLGGRRKGKRGRGAGGKVPVFGILKMQGYVQTVIIPNASSKTLFPIIQEKIRPDTIVYTDSFAAYDVLDVFEFQHYRINHSELFAENANHINEIENCWNQEKDICEAISAYRRNTSIYSSKSANGVSTANRLPTSTKYFKIVIKLKTKPLSMSAPKIIIIVLSR